MKKIFLFLMAFAISVHAAVFNGPSVGTAQARIAPDPDFQYTFDHLQGVPAFRKYKVGTVMRESYTTLICVYDFATQGGANGTYGLLMEDLKTPCTLPGRSVVRNAFYDITTPIACNNGVVTPSFALSTGQAAGDLQTTVVSPGFAMKGGTTAAGDNLSTGSGQNLLSPVFATITTYIKLQQANVVSAGVNANPYQPAFTVTNGPITAGHFRVFIDFSLSE